MKKSILIASLLFACTLASCNSNNSSTTPSIDGNDSTETTTSQPDLPDSISNEGEDSTSTQDPIDVEHEIKITNIEEKGVSAISNFAQAKRGEKITITVTNEMPEKTEVTGVTINDTIVATPTSEANKFEFTMPDEVANVTIDVEDITYTITSLSTSATYLKGMPEKAQVGDEITFSILLEPGYHFLNEITLFSGVKDEDSYIEYDLTFVEKYTYSFTMPNVDVKIEVLTDKTEYSVKDITEYGSTIDGSFKNLTTDVSSYNLFAHAGDEIEVNLRNTDSKFAKGIIINGKEKVLLKDGESKVTFIMPACPVEIDEFTVPYEREITIENSDNLTATLYKLVDEELIETTTGVYNEYIYVGIEGENENIGLNEVVVKYNNGDKVDVTIVEIDGKNYYRFVMKEYNDVTVTISEQNLSKYKGKEFVGEYLGRNLYDNSIGEDLDLGGTGWKYRDLTITSAGYITKPTDESYFNSAISELDETNKSFVTTKYYTDYKFYYSNNIIYSSQDPSNLSPTFDGLFYIKKSSDYSVYTVDYVGFSNNHQIVSFYGDGNLIQSAYVDYSTNELFLDVTISMVTGDTFNTATSEFDIISNGSIIRKIRNTGTSSNNTDGFFISNGLEGTYLDSASTDADLIIIDGKDKASYDGIEYTYIYEKEANSIVIGEINTRFTLDVSNKTYVKEILEGPINDYIDKTYAGEFTDSWTDYYDYEITFISETECKIEIYQGYSKYYPSNHPNDGIDVYELNLDGTLTVHMYDGSTEVTLTFTPNDDKTTLTIEDNYTSFYETKGTVLNLK